MAKDSLSGATVLVTGGSRGVGFATARAFLRQGARVAICARDPQRLENAQHELQRFGEIDAAVVDVRVGHAIRAWVERAHDRFGSVDALINNAGVLWVGQFAAQPADAIDDLVDVNIKGLLHATSAALPYMLAQRAGVIVNIASGAGLTGYPQLAAYCATKFAVVGFTQSLDQEVRDNGVRVYALCPGAIATDMIVQFAGAKMGMNPDAVADKIVEHAHPRCKARTGVCLPVD